MPGLDVGPVEEKEVREVGHRGAEVRAGVVVVPRVAQRAAGPAADLIRREEPCCVEAGGEHEHVDVELAAVGGHDGM